MAFEDITKQLKATDERIAYAKELAAKGNFDKAEKILRKNLNSVVELYGSNSLKTCNFLLDLAEVNYHQEKYAEVITTLQQILITNSQDPIYPKEDILSIKFKFARALENSGNIQDACNGYAELLYDSEAIFGPEARFTKSVAESLNRIAKRHKQRIGNVKRVEEKVSQFDTSKNIIVKVPGEVDPQPQKQSPPQPQPQANTDSADQAQGNLLRFNAIEDKKNQLYLFRPIVSAIAVSLLCVGLFLSGVLTNNIFATDGDKTQIHTAEATAALEPQEEPLDPLALNPGTYSTTDGLKVLIINQDGKGKLIANNQQKQVSVEKHGVEIYAVNGDENIVFRNAEHGIVDQYGSILFKAGTPELDTAAQVRTLAANLNGYFRKFGHYPNCQSKLRSMNDSGMYKNPMTDTYSYPRLMSVIERRTSSRMSLTDYSYVNDFTSRLVSLSDTPGTPGAVEIYVCPISERGETVVIRGYDSKGKLLPCSSNGRCYSIILNDGATHS